MGLYDDVENPAYGDDGEAVRTRRRRTRTPSRERALDSLRTAIRQIKSLRDRADELGLDARKLSVSITEAETSELWLRDAAC